MSGAKTEEPTPRRLRKARDEGDSGASAFAAQAIALVAGVALLPAAVTAIALRVEERLREAIQRAKSRAAFGCGPFFTKAIVLISVTVGVALTKATVCPLRSKRAAS